MIPQGVNLSSRAVACLTDKEGRMPDVYSVHGQWAVTSYGVECLTDPYSIHYLRVWEPDWLRHMDGKTWVNFTDFRQALLEAQRRWRKGWHRGSVRRRFEVLARDGFRCQLCGRTPSDGVKLEVDHKHPKSLGGSDDLENLWTLCWDCNHGKSDLTLPECAEAL